MTEDVSSFFFIEIGVVTERDVNTFRIVRIGMAAVQNILHEGEFVVIEAFLRCHFTRVDGTCLEREMAHMMGSDDCFQLDNISFGIACLDGRI